MGPGKRRVTACPFLRPLAEATKAEATKTAFSVRLSWSMDFSLRPVQLLQAFHLDSALPLRPNALHCRHRCRKSGDAGDALLDRSPSNRALVKVRRPAERRVDDEID